MFRVLVIGCGSIGLRHTRNLVDHFPYEVAVQDPRRPDVIPSGVRYFAELDEALDWRPHASIVATPTHLHVDTARRVLAVGSHVLVEKPISTTTAGLDDLSDLARQRGLAAMVACNMRFHPGPVALFEHLGALDTVYFTRAEAGYYLPAHRPGVDYRTVYAANRAQGGGPIMDYIHEVDYHVSMFGRIGQMTARTAKLSDLDIDVEDYAAMHLTFESGVQAEIHVDFLQRCRRRTCQIVGEGGTLIWESQGKGPEICTVRLFRESMGRWETIVDQKIDDFNFMYVDELKHFFACIETGIAPVATIEHGKHLVEKILPAVEYASPRTERNPYILRGVA